MSTKIKVGAVVTYGVNNEHYKVLCVAEHAKIATIIPARSADPADAFMVDTDHLFPVPDNPKLNRDYTSLQLAQARVKRENTLARLTEEYAACCCAYPIVSYRNVHGHDGGCPAAALKMKWREEGGT